MNYLVKALRGSEPITALHIDAVDARDASLQACARGYSVIEVVSTASPWTTLRRRRAGLPLLQFSQELCALLQAGLPMVEALQTLAESDHRPDVRRVLGRLIERLREGQSLSRALEELPGSFPPLYVAMVRASEKSGALAEALTRYVAYRQQVERVRRQVLGAALYPLLLMAVGALVVVFLLAYVVPRFGRIYAELTTDLPLLSRVLMHWSQALESYGGTILAAAAAAAAGTAFALTRPAARRWLDDRLWRLPALGARLRIYQLARFYWTLGMLLRGGAPVVAALQMVSGLLPATLQRPLAQATAGIRQGWSISRAMDDAGLTTPIASRMLKVGERTGEMGTMMDRIAAFYDDETARWIEGFARLFEPLLMLVIGLVIGTIVVLMYLPVFELAGSIR